MKIAVISDTHCGVRNSAEVFIEHQRQFYENVFFPYLKEHGISHILHLGDYYDHRKYINFKALHANRKHFLEPMRELGMTMDIIPGNHDVAYKNTNDLCSLKELLGHFTSNINIVMKNRVMDYDGMNIGLVPWINPENYAATMEFLAKCDAPWIAGHFELAGFELMKGIMNDHGMGTEPFHRFEKVISGHFHTKSEKGNIVYLGSQMEFTWSDVDDPKYFHVIDTADRSLTAVRNPLTLFHRLVYDKQPPKIERATVENKFVKLVVAEKGDPFEFDRFIEKINDLKPYDFKIAETFEEFSGGASNIVDVESVENTATLLSSYVNSIETDLDKTRLKSLMHTLYSEASNMDMS